MSQNQRRSKYDFLVNPNLPKAYKRNGHYYNNLRKLRGADSRAAINDAERRRAGTLASSSSDDDGEYYVPPPTQINNMLAQGDDDVVFPSSLPAVASAPTVVRIPFNNTVIEPPTQNEIIAEELREHIEIVNKLDSELFTDLANWAKTSRVHLVHLTSLLKLLEKHGLKDIPKDARTLLRTPRRTEIVPMGDGRFWYDGIAKNLISSLEPLEPLPNKIELLVNIDGISPFKSTGKQFWPISFKIFRCKFIKPMFAGIYYGPGKPPLEEYFEQFITEFNVILQNGIKVRDVTIEVKLKAFVCDTPARCFIKSVAYYTSKEGGCIKCNVGGKYEKKHISFNHFDCERRTDEDFRNMTDLLQIN